MKPVPIIPRAIDLIWNHTRVCGFNCSNCCVAAVHAKKTSISKPDLSAYERINRHKGEDHFAAAQRILQERGHELALEGKLRVLQHLKGHDVRVDVSGGDALVTPDGLDLLDACAAHLGRHNVTLTVTGMQVPDQVLDRVASSIAEFNFTFNAADAKDAVVSPKGYAELNLLLGRKMKAKGVTVRAECPLTRSAADPMHLTRLYDRLCEAGIDKLLIMRQFPVGRGKLLPDQVPSREEYIRAISTLRELEAKRAGPQIKLQCALRHIEVMAGIAPPSEKNPCDLGVTSYGLMADGTLLASPWAMDEHGLPLNEAWVLGKLDQQPLSELLASKKAQTIIGRAHENHGQCKIFAALHSTRHDALDRMFDHSDPLYDSPV